MKRSVYPVAEVGRLLRRFDAAAATHGTDVVKYAATLWCKRVSAMKKIQRERARLRKTLRELGKSRIKGFVVATAPALRRGRR